VRASGGVTTSNTATTMGEVRFTTRRTGWTALNPREREEERPEAMSDYDSAPTDPHHGGKIWKE
jgi:hypothetical protein